MGPVVDRAASTQLLHASMGEQVQRLGYRIANTLIQADRGIRRSHGRGVKLILEDACGRILLVSHTYGRRHWTFPGGGVRSNEDPLSAGRRECLEELGISPESLDLLGTHPARSKRRIDVVSVFLLRGFRPEAIEANPVELSSLCWISTSELPSNIDPNVRVALGLLQGRNAEIAASRDHAT